MSHNADYVAVLLEVKAVELYQHNRTAYGNALTMMAQTGKAAIIHPTGTGKSFIAFQLALDNPDKRICWLSPSEYIFKTQLENLADANGGVVPENMIFYTYAKLPLLTAEEVDTIQPDYIVLDEFHRCGAQVWGAGVRSVLDRYADTPILGLSATNIRYLDNQRDMADELFDGNIASQMSLGEAIVRGILNPPKYVLSVFSYQKDLEKYQHRIRSAKSKAVRDEGEKYLEALRRALEKADGLDEIFHKHMHNPVGKYIVFCANKEHMDEMIALASEWFYKVDRKPHIYSAYSDDPETSRAFERGGAMNEIANRLNTYIQSHPFDAGDSGCETVLEQLYQAYAESHESDPEEIGDGFKELEGFLCVLSLDDNNAVFNLCCRLCSAYERKAFLDGLQYGAQLMRELE